MYLIRGLKNINLFKERFSDFRVIATIGNFDGLHLGHQKIISDMKNIANEKKLKTMVIFTEPHAKEFFAESSNSSSQPSRISPWRDKFQRLKAQGVDFAFYLNFNKKLQSMTPEKFINNVLGNLNSHYLTIGDDFKFGNRRKGDYEMLENWGSLNDVIVQQTPTYLRGDRRYSSSWIREALDKDDFELAAELLGRRYTFSGKVVSGNSLGRTIGVPTANLWLPKSNLPIKGVYAVKVHYEKEILLGIANMGIRPTIGGENPVLEVHIFDFDKNLYGKRIEVEFCNKIREEKKFSNLEELKSQIHKDIELSKNLLIS
jgi:riboflavin kinase/FMN adenylyltransferase